MRILHTSDWHLGRSFGDHRLLDQQARFIDWLVDVVQAESIDLVVIAGDLYDRSVPPADAVELFHSALRRLLDTGAEVAAIAGNHDSAERIGSTDGLLTSGLLLRGGYGAAAQVDVRHFRDGPLAIVAVPFLDPAFAPLDRTDQQQDHVGEPARPTHESVLRTAIDRARAQLAPGMRSLAIAHAFVTGAEPSDSERTLAVGDAAMVSSSVFANLDYVALGHLHRAQIVGGDERVRYSGAPLAYSFGETSQKEVVLIELDDDGDARSKPIPVDVGRTVTTVRGTLDDLLAGTANLDDWVRVELTNPHPVADAHRRLRDHFPHMVEIVRTAPRVAEVPRLTAQAVRQRTSAELATQFLHAVDDSVDDDDLALVLDALQRAAEAG
ncbi:MAG: exonuclease SbcCD subunit D C-terminal domain-containing protein [Actinomycetota bacterium]